MITINIIPYSAEYSESATAECEEMQQQSLLRYSMLQLIQEGVTDRESFRRALDQVIRVCRYGDIRLSEHLREVYTYDAETHEMGTDWLMSKRALKLIVMQQPELHERMELWLRDESEF
jgi:hypothetical protein